MRLRNLPRVGRTRLFSRLLAFRARKSVQQRRLLLLLLASMVLITVAAFMAQRFSLI